MTRNRLRSILYIGMVIALTIVLAVGFPLSSVQAGCGSCEGGSPGSSTGGRGDCGTCSDGVTTYNYGTCDPNGEGECTESSQPQTVTTPMTKTEKGILGQLACGVVLEICSNTAGLDLAAQQACACNYGTSILVSCDADLENLVESNFVDGC